MPNKSNLALFEGRLAVKIWAPQLKFFFTFTWLCS